MDVEAGCNQEYHTSTGNYGYYFCYVIRVEPILLFRIINSEKEYYNTENEQRIDNDIEATQFITNKFINKIVSVKPKGF